MALPSIGGGYQLGDGNVNEIVLGEMADPQTATATATLTAAQMTGFMLVANPSAVAASYTLPTVASVEAILVNAKVGSTFDLFLVNLGTGAGIVTLVAGTGWTLVGSAATAISSSTRFIARKTGDLSWTLYRAS